MNVSEINLTAETATLISNDFAFDVEFSGRSFKDGNAFESWNDVEIESVKLVQAHNEDGKFDHVLSSDEESQYHLKNLL